MSTFQGEEFYKTGFGWITPKGKLLGGAMLSHINIVRNDPLLSNEIRELIDKAEEVRKECEELEYQSSRTDAEWHTYEIAIDSVVARIYQEGYIRLAVFGSILGIEGLKAAIQSRMDLINQIKERYEQEHDVELYISGNKR